jgi:hypothetical protein
VSISEIIPAEQSVGTAPRGHRRLAALPALPDIAPGQLWLVELPTASGAPSTPASHAVDGANVVIYDRALAEWLAASLPLGTYAEPAPAATGLGDAAASRCVRFARDGWSVARLLPARLPQRERARRVRDVVDELVAAKVSGALPVSVLAEIGGVAERTDTRLDRLTDTVATYGRDARLTIVIGAFAAGAAARLHAVAANGLAG